MDFGHPHSLISSTSWHSANVTDFLLAGSLARRLLSSATSSSKSCDSYLPPPLPMAEKRASMAESSQPLDQELAFRCPLRRRPRPSLLRKTTGLLRIPARLLVLFALESREP